MYRNHESSSVGLRPTQNPRQCCLSWLCVITFSAPYDEICANAQLVIATDLIKNTLADEMATARINAMHPFGGVGKATDIAKAVLFLCSPDNTYMTGANMVVDGGYTAL